MATRDCLIIIPALNEEASIGAALQDLARHLPEADVLVIDDGSSDATGAVARHHGAFVATLPFNIGIGAALRTGFRFASHNNYRRAAQFDADGQHHARELPKLLAAVDAGADLAIGSRFTDASGDYSVGQTRGLAMSLLRMTLRMITKQHFTDTSSGFRAFSKPMIDEFASNYPREYMDSVEALVLASRGGFRIAEVPADVGERTGGVPSNRSMKLAYNYIRLLVVLVSGVQVRKSKRVRSTV